MSYREGPSSACTYSSSRCHSKSPIGAITDNSRRQDFKSQKRQDSVQAPKVMYTYALLSRHHHQKKPIQLPREQLDMCTTACGYVVSSKETNQPGWCCIHQPPTFRGTPAIEYIHFPAAYGISQMRKHIIRLLSVSHPSSAHQSSVTSGCISTSRNHHSHFKKLPLVLASCSS